MVITSQNRKEAEVASVSSGSVRAQFAVREGPGLSEYQDTAAR